MKLLALLVVVSLAVDIDAKCGGEKTVAQIKTYKIDLDLAPKDRFKQVTNDFKEPMNEWLQAEKKQIDSKYLPFFEVLASGIDEFLPYPFNEEMKGIAEALDVSLGDVVLINLIYDLTAFCTGVLAVDSNGQILHGRNLDYNLSNYLQRLTYIGEFYKNDTLVFTSAQIAGFLGVLTGHKYNKFTFEINERNQGQWWVNALFLILDKKATPLSFLTRHLMENMTSYDDAVNLMSKSDLIAPAYFIIGGVKPYEATVITRNQSSVVDTWRFNPNPISPDFDRWFLIETNYDHWTKPPANDNRRDPGIAAMKKTTQANLNYETLLDVMSVDPVCNSGTVYTVAMSARDESKDGFKIIVR